MNIEKITGELGLDSHLSYQQVFGGEDSSVWKIENQSETYALRILPPSGYEQFVREHEVIGIARDHRILVPKVIAVHLGEDYAAMLMEWAQGNTVFQELQEHPENAELLGKEFGKVLASIHSISIPQSVAMKEQGWLTPGTDQEAELINIIHERVSSQRQALLHLDYHPLNVLTDGVKITAVIDWANATIGDYRFDLARTYSVLKLEGAKHFYKNPRVLENFLRGWLDAYTANAEESPLSFALFNAWAGLRMERDLAGKRSEADYKKIRQWVSEWIAKA